ncbi:hypothetical protein [Leuconostoc lactis]|uniref:hypothetical protein n=1 Tax=Leuconostoc lactis TaxID=1246 RepID=UPI00289DC428|nr:hypothetical protein [Leuconostoc lactis]
MSNRELLVYYFSGAFDDYLDYLNELSSPPNKFRADKIHFLNEVKEKLDPFKAKLTPELLDMYVQHYINRVPMGNFYNIVAPTSYIMALNNELRNIPKGIERPESPYAEI